MRNSIKADKQLRASIAANTKAIELLMPKAPELVSTLVEQSAEAGDSASLFPSGGALTYGTTGYDSNNDLPPAAGPGQTVANFSASFQFASANQIYAVAPCHQSRTHCRVFITNAFGNTIGFLGDVLPRRAVESSATAVYDLIHQLSITVGKREDGGAYGFLRRFTTSSPLLRDNALAVEANQLFRPADAEREFAMEPGKSYNLLTPMLTLTGRLSATAVGGASANCSEGALLGRFNTKTDGATIPNADVCSIKMPLLATGFIAVNLHLLSTAAASTSLFLRATYLPTGGGAAVSVNIEQFDAGVSVPNADTAFDAYIIIDLDAVVDITGAPVDGVITDLAVRNGAVALAYSEADFNVNGLNWDPLVSPYAQVFVVHGQDANTIVTVDASHVLSFVRTDDAFSTQATQPWISIVQHLEAQQRLFGHEPAIMQSAPGGALSFKGFLRGAGRVVRSAAPFLPPLYRNLARAVAN